MNVVELLSRGEAKLAWANGKKLQIANTVVGEDFYDMDDSNTTLNIFDLDFYQFRLKPRTITINGIEVPAPFEPKEGDKYYHISIQTSIGYGWDEWESSNYDARASIFGAWRTEEEIKQVVSVLRNVLGAQS